MASLLRVAVGILSLVILSNAENATTVCAWFQPRAGTVRDTLYIDGGVLINNSWSAGGWQSEDPQQWEPQAYLYRFNYGTAFEYEDSPPDLNELLEKTYLTATGARYDAPLYRDGAMFTDEYELYTFGGLPVEGESAATILNYRLFESDGQTIFTGGPNLNYALSNVDNYVMAGASVSVPSEKLAFYFSGLRKTDGSAFTVRTDPELLEISNSLIKVDMSSPGEADWTEIPLPASSIDQLTMGRADGQLVWIPVGSQGILLAIGGVIYPQDRYGYDLDSDQIDESQQRSPGFMTNIVVYDIATNEFYSQPTTGDVHPGQLSKSCAVVGGAPGDSSFEVYMYGGDNGLPSNDALNAQDEIWALSVPSFTWTKVKDAKPGHGRSGHVCSTPLPNQMLVVGGWNYDEDGFCIPDGSVVDLFNLNTLEWTREYDPDSYENYTTPVSIRTTPRAALEPAVEALFATPYSKPIRTWYPYEEDSPSSPTPIGAIVGGVVGGAAVIIILFLIWYFRIRKRKDQAQSESGTSDTRVSRWRRGVQHPSTDLPYVPKDLASETTTEVDPQISPPAEAYGDYYFRERTYASPVTIQNSTPLEDNMSHSHSTRRISYQSGQTPRSPQSLQPGSLEADGEEVHEKDGNVRVSQLSDLGQATVDIRQHPAYPYSIDRVASSDHDSISAAHRNPLGSNISHVSGRTRQHSNTVPSPVMPGASIQEVDNGNANTNEKGTDTIASGPITASRTVRPSHQRRGSSMSSDFPITPPADHDTDRSRPPLEMRMSATSGPISPLLGVSEHPERPAHHRNNSSMSSGLSGNIALPPPLNPMSPSSMYSPVPTSEAIETDSRNFLEKTREQEQQEEEEYKAMSAEPTLIGGGPSPMTEIINPLGLRMGAMAQTLDTRTPTTATNTTMGNGNSSPTSPRRKPVGGFNQSQPKGFGSAYEENGGSRGLR